MIIGLGIILSMSCFFVDPAASLVYTDNQEIMRVIVDIDAACDDWQALLYLLKHPNVQVLGIGVSCGVSYVDTGVINTLSILEYLGVYDIPVAAGKETPLVGDHAFPTPWRDASYNFYGLDLPTTTLQPSPLTASDLFISLIESEQGNVTLIGLGPLTNVAIALETEPSIKSKIDAILIMGGTIEAPGNVGLESDIPNYVAEWNLWVDPYAADIVFNSGLPIRMIGLDASNYVPQTQDFRDRLESVMKTPAAYLLHDMIEVGIYFWDDLTAVSLTNPEVVTFEPHYIEIVLDVENHEGQTNSTDTEPPNALVAMSADASLFEYLLVGYINDELPSTTVYIDIKPGSWPNPVNLENKGVFPIAICGTNEFDVMKIDPLTITMSLKRALDTVSPIRFSYEDVATPYTGNSEGDHVSESDGSLDIVLHFDTQDVISSLGLDLYAGQETALYITGRLYDEYDGEKFTGFDYVKVVGVPLLSEMAIIWETDTNPEPYSGHSGCDVLYAFGKYWLYYDWVAEGGAPWNPNIYMRYSSDAKTWSDAITLADELVPEHSVKAFYCDNTIYITYIRGQELYYQTSTDGLTYSPPNLMLELPSVGPYSGDIEIVYGNGVFYLASMFDSQDIWIIRSVDLQSWSEPCLAAGDPEVIDYLCDLCWADGQLWLLWDKSVSGSPAYLFTAYSTDGIQWSPPIQIPPFRTSYEHWGASVIWDNGQFLLIARIAEPISHGSSPPFITYRWRLYLTSSEDGINWTPLQQATELFLDGDYGEKGPGIFPIYKGSRSFSYSVIYKKYWFEGPYQLCQSFFDRWKK